MEEELDFKATIDRSAMLTIQSGEEILSHRKIEKADQRGSFTHNGEKITWIAEIRKPRTGRGKIYLYMYPINLNYKENPLEVSEV